ncbi:hypothetical protein STRDD11_02244 [Streptococcus sp. DD11]|nr:hypothetical protein STRDD11_02244 [Streptococcus sp. DD11]
MTQIFIENILDRYRNEEQEADEDAAIMGVSYGIFQKESAATMGSVPVF